MNKIDYKNKHGIMVGYIDNSQNVVAVETGWKTTPEALTEVLMSQYNSKEMAQELVDSPTLMPTFKKDDYWYVDGFGEMKHVVNTVFGKRGDENLELFARMVARMVSPKTPKPLTVSLALKDASLEQHEDMKRLIESIL